MMKCPKCKKDSTRLRAEIYVCRQDKKILNPEQLLKFLERLVDAIPPLKTQNYKNFVNDIERLIIAQKMVDN